MASDVLGFRSGDGGTYLTPASYASGLRPGNDAHPAAGEDEDALINAHKPLTGVVLCCTAIPPETRSALAEAATPLGATHALDLTAAVTHLLVGHWDTAKYAFVARARPDVRALSPDFVDAAREKWMSGADHVDVAALERSHAYPTFGGVRVCVTGFGDAEERRGIEARVCAAGGEYTGDLTREVTHLIAAKPEGAKYAAARQWKTHIVVLRWLEESLKRGMVLEAARYDPLLPPEEIGRGAWIRPSVAELEPRKDGAKRKSESEGGPGPTRKLRRTASAKFSSQNENIWGEIVHGGVAKEQKRDAWEEQGAPGTSVSSDRQQVRVPQRSASTGSLLSKANTSEQSESGPPHKGGIFAGMTIYIHGFGEREVRLLTDTVVTFSNDDRTLFSPAISVLTVPRSPPIPPPSLQPTSLLLLRILRLLHASSFSSHIIGILPPFPSPSPPSNHRHL
jgi:DNA replication regulator DPB11